MAIADGISNRKQKTCFDERQNPRSRTGRSRRSAATFVRQPRRERDRVGGKGRRSGDGTGTLLGPSNALLFSPVFGTAQVGVFRADKADTSLSRRVHEIVVLTVGAAWRSDDELYAHSAMANLAGLPDDLIRALASDQPPFFESDEEATAHAFAWQLTHNHHVDQETYARVVRAFGYKGVVDIVILTGMMSISNSSTAPARLNQSGASDHRHVFVAGRRPAWRIALSSPSPTNVKMSPEPSLGCLAGG